VAKQPLTLRAYLAATHVVPFLAKLHLKKRIARGKEHPTRWTEKLGQPSVARPDGILIWLHAVGLGEVLSLRGLIAQMASITDAHFLVTSSTLAGASAFSQNMPPRTIHQFLPLDAPNYRHAFLDHWQPDLCIWAEQDLWPGFVTTLANRRIPQAMISARMTKGSFHNKARLHSFFAHLYKQMALITAYDQDTAKSLNYLGAEKVTVSGSLKPSAPALSHDPLDLAALQSTIRARFTWITAPSHLADEVLAIAAHKRLRTQIPDAFLIIAPRFPNRKITPDMSTKRRSKGEMPTANTAIYLADTLGELGLFYCLAKAAFIGGTNDSTEGHSPWEAANLHTAIIHGPCTANFKADYDLLHAENAAICVTTEQSLANALSQDLSTQITNAERAIAGQHAVIKNLAQDLVALT
jgi:3-deoxy-D-manno-octulosonic-acid transferase